MNTPVMNSEGVLAALKQRFPMIMVDSVISLEAGKRIRAIKNVTATEIYSQGHFPGHSVLPRTLIVEAIGQSASILFTKSAGTGTEPGVFLMLASVTEMVFLKPVIAGDRMEIDVCVCKFIAGFAIVEAVVTVDRSEVARGKLGFAKRDFGADPE